MNRILPYGSWPSPISAAEAAVSSPRIDGACFVGDDVWWGQTVPAERGRTTIMSRAAGVLLPAPWDARSRVHEYGGGAWAATSSGELVFVEKTDQRVWMLTPGGEPHALTPAAEGVRYGGLTVSAGRLLAVRETDESTSRTPHRDIVEVPLDGSAAADAGAISTLAGGSDFLAQPALSPDGERLAWVAWNHPSMPWDATELRVGAPGSDEWVVVAGGERRAPLQPQWDGDDLLFVDDPDGRWNLFRWRNGDVEVVAPADSDTGGPLWVLGERWYAPVDSEPGRIVAVRTNGSDELVVIGADGVRPVSLPARAELTIEDVSGPRVLVSGSGDGGPGLWLVDLDTGRAEAVAGGVARWGEEWMPRSRAVTFSGTHGEVHAFAFPPTNPSVASPADELPPYVVFVHGGPTAHVGGAATAKIAYLTSRGIGVLDVNYGGSTGYGRAYRERLLGQWGVVDVDDVIAAAQGMAGAGLADPRRIAIAGGSAGGWTVLSALARSDVFAAGISRYGVADLRALAADTHDFEARYLDGLVGPLPEAEAVYIERSPLSHLDGFTAPLLIEQGLEDPVVPPAQSEAVRDALAARGIPHAYLAFEGESHGFRRAETIIRTLEAEVAFLGAVFGFEPDGVEPLELS
ncbi:prolyl oligopeptidase family serine peptidase [Microbacterium sp. ASV49]|uniref:Prolyl oligopeptidase family serine peptidase n=1 Tax=Microbacterium candidum TaxID=3041922 RepID=A0ABT7N1J4_9MICO|nr:prolyl oligopeptidase family serine peptidase [Microbacterium sp. ASV49]MDL9980536.1 prolyl oligopeptidase family serine peptidase [Microbacterium sp. ASV49]